MRRFLLFLLIFLITFSAVDCRSGAESSDTITAVYFYSPTCSSCMNMTEVLKSLSQSHKNLYIKKYDISDLRNKSLLDKYCDAYRVSGEDSGTVPAVFIGDRYFLDGASLKNNIEKIISSSGVKTLEIDSTVENHQKDLKRFEGFKLLSVFFAGVINGINPCSLSMLLFFLSLLTVNKRKIIKIGLAFITGKFLAFLLLGTVFFRFLSYLNLGFLSVLMKALLAVVLLILIVMNVQDYFASKAERYDRIFLQLPEALRRINHRIIKKASAFSSLKIISLISFLLGLIISFGEFLCTGQIYLATIVTIFQTNPKFSSQALLYLVVYNLGVILPLGILIFVIYTGKEIFEVSEVIRGRLHIIKMTNALIFLVLGVIILFFL
ncbi:MAG TPA: glutaredoxin [Ruminiclostridium sp.]|nr:glutaredoxin [Ruminiclostridium sp.]